MSALAMRVSQRGREEREAANLTVAVRWISRADRYPDADQTVLIALDDTHAEPIWLGWTDGARWWNVNAEEVTGCVTHWAELPLAPTPSAAVGKANGAAS